jgi:phage tail protein X
VTVPDTFIEHTAKDGERWDHLAARYYGQAGAFAGIVAANPNVPITTTLTAGTVVRVPVLDEADVATAITLPPWKR